MDSGYKNKLLTDVIAAQQSQINSMAEEIHLLKSKLMEEDDVIGALKRHLAEADSHMVAFLDENAYIREENQRLQQELDFVRNVLRKESGTILSLKELLARQEMLDRGEEYDEEEIPF